MPIHILIHECHDGCIEALVTHGQVQKVAELNCVYLHANTRSALAAQLAMGMSTNNLC